MVTHWLVISTYKMNSSTLAHNLTEINATTVMDLDRTLYRTIAQVTTDLTTMSGDDLSYREGSLHREHLHRDRICDGSVHLSEYCQ